MTYELREWRVRLTLDTKELATLLGVPHYKIITWEFCRAADQSPEGEALLELIQGNSGWLPNAVELSKMMKRQANRAARLARKTKQRDPALDDDQLAAFYPVYEHFEPFGFEVSELDFSVHDFPFDNSSLAVDEMHCFHCGAALPLRRLKKPRNSTRKSRR